MLWKFEIKLRLIADFSALPLDDDYKDEKGLSILCNGKHDIDMLMLYRQVFESEDWVNFELSVPDKEIQKDINSQFIMTDVMEDLFYEEFDKEVDYQAPLYSCSDILRKLGYGTTQISKKMKNELATFLRLKNYPYLKREGKFRLVAKRKEVTSNDSEVQKEAY